MAGAAMGPGAALAKLMRGGGRRARIHVPAHLRSKTSSADHPCAWYCTGCGFMVHPRELTRAGPPGPCLWCRQSDWADLGEGGVVEALITVDDDRRDTRDESKGAAFGLLGGIAVSGIAVLLATTFLLEIAEDPEMEAGELAGGLVGFVFMFLFFSVFAMLGAILLRRGIRRFRAGARPMFPTRWSYAPVRVSIFAASRTGLVEGTPELRGPISGTPCLAYEFGVRPDDIDIDKAWSWSVLEQQVGPMTVDGQALPGDVQLRCAPIPIARPAEGDPRAAEVERALRERGIDPQRPGYELYETVVLPGETVSVKGAGRRSVLIVAG